MYRSIIILIVIITSFSACRSYNQNNVSNNSEQEIVEDKQEEVDEIPPIVDITQQERSNYYYKNVTRKLIKELGGIDSLYKYQFYLSDSLSLQYIDNVKSNSAEGDVKELERQHTIIFTKDTPGVFKSYNKYDKNDTYKIRDHINVYFDNGDDAYLTFEEDFFSSGMGGNNKYESIGYYLYYSPQLKGYHYKSKGCSRLGNSNSKVQLIVRIEKSEIKTKEIVKGRTL